MIQKRLIVLQLRFEFSMDAKALGGIPVLIASLTHQDGPSTSLLRRIYVLSSSDSYNLSALFPSSWGSSAFELALGIKRFLQRRR